MVAFSKSRIFQSYYHVLKILDLNKPAQDKIEIETDIGAPYLLHHVYREEFKRSHVRDSFKNKMTDKNVV